MSTDRCQSKDDLSNVTSQSRWLNLISLLLLELLYLETDRSLCCKFLAPPYRGGLCPPPGPTPEPRHGCGAAAGTRRMQGHEAQRKGYFASSVCSRRGHPTIQNQPLLVICSICMYICVYIYMYIRTYR